VGNMMNDKREIAQKLKIQNTVIGGLSIITGLIYLTYLYGPTEREVTLWGVVSIIFGLGVLGLLLIKNFEYYRVISVALNIVLVCLQVLPIIMWFLFHGNGISDGTPQSDFVAHWVYSMPHIFLVILNIKSIRDIKKCFRD